MSETETRHDQDHKAAVRREWTMAAPGWERWFDTTEAAGAGRAITAVLLEHVDLQSGDAVLDVGAGYGEPGLSALPQSGPRVESRAWTSQATCWIRRAPRPPSPPDERDASSRPTSSATTPRRRVRRGPQPRRADVRDRPPLDVAPPPRGAPPQRSARRRRVGEPGPRGVLTASRRHDRDGRDRSATPRPRSLRTRRRRSRSKVSSETAGFTDVRAGSAVAVYETPSPEACTQWFRDVAPPITELISDRPADVQEQVWERVTKAWAPFTDSNGAVRLPCSAMWAAGVKDS